MAKAIIFLCDGFEESEAIITIDLLRRAEVTVDLVSAQANLLVTSADNIELKADYLITDCNLGDYDAYIVPGGAGVQGLLKNPIVLSALANAYQTDKLICAICAGPLVLAAAGILRDQQYTCYPSVEIPNMDPELYLNQQVVQTGNIITSQSPTTTFNFALAIIKNIAENGVQVENRIRNNLLHLD